jgi:hypothetical protein
MIKIRLITFCLILVATGEGRAMSGDFPTSGLPEKINGWAVSAEDSYDRETLFEYINGGAELYLSYDFARMVSRMYVRDEQPDIVVDVFDMRHSFNAFGVFSHAREEMDDTFGQGSQYTEGLLLFWKGRYFVSILGSPETPDLRDTIHELAGRIEGAIGETGPLPELLSVLPQEGLIEESVRYFSHHIWLNSHYYIADDNILGIDPDNRAVLAAYRENDSRAFVLAVRYAGEEAATAALASFTAHYLPERTGAAPVQIEDGSWSGCRTDGDLLVAVFNAPTEKSADTLVESVLKNNRTRR